MRLWSNGKGNGLLFRTMWVRLLPGAPTITVMKHPIMLTLLLASTSAFADYTSTLELAECEKIASSGSMTGAVVGSATGAVAGAAVGRMIFGKSGGWLGGIVGSVGGGAAGENIAGSSTYRCIVKFKDPQGKLVLQEAVGKQRRVGDPVKVFVSDNGTVVK